MIGIKDSGLILAVNAASKVLRRGRDMHSLGLTGPVLDNGVWLKGIWSLKRLLFEFDGLDGPPFTYTKNPHDCLQLIEDVVSLVNPALKRLKELFPNMDT